MEFAKALEVIFSYNGVCVLAITFFLFAVYKQIVNSKLRKKLESYKVEIELGEADLGEAEKRINELESDLSVAESDLEQVRKESRSKNNTFQQYIEELQVGVHGFEKWIVEDAENRVLTVFKRSFNQLIVECAGIFQPGCLDEHSSSLTAVSQEVKGLNKYDYNNFTSLVSLFKDYVDELNDCDLFWDKKKDLLKRFKAVANEIADIDGDLSVIRTSIKDNSYAEIDVRQRHIHKLIARIESNFPTLV